MLHYTSNFSIMPSDTTLELWSRFKLVKWVASLDGVGERFSFLRWPYQFQNLQKFVTQAKTCVPGNVMFGAEHTINVLNAFYFDEFEQWFNQQLATNQSGDASDLNLHPCWGTMSLNHMPESLRERIKQKFGPNHTIVRMIEQHPYSGSTDQLTQYLDQLDSLRKQSWRTTFAEIQEYFS